MLLYAGLYVFLRPNQNGNVFRNVLTSRLPTYKGVCDWTSDDSIEKILLSFSR